MSRGFTRAVLGSAVLSLLALSVPERAAAQYSSENVTLYSQIALNQFPSNPSMGNDCWGYVSPSGREYALMGLHNAAAFVEISDPANPVIVDSLAHPGSTWCDIKVYDHYAYIVTDQTGVGIQVVDLSMIDSGIVSLVRTLPSPQTSHNVAVDTDSGFLYTLGSGRGSSTSSCWDLSDPANPVRAGQSTMTANYQHDAQIVTYTSGQYAGRQIMFGCSEGRGVEITDVTDKNNPFQVSLTPYPGVNYTHQCWLSEDRRYLYVDDELDELNGARSTTTTFVWNVSDLSTPVLAGTFTTGLPSIDHNLYVRGDFIYEADYTSGLRIFNACDPVSPVEVGWFDTHPESNATAFDGSWSVYPFFPSGTVIISDINRGLFVVDVSAALAAPAIGALGFEYPGGRPETINPNGGTRMRVEVLAGTCNSDPQPGTGLLHYDIGAGFVSVPMEVVAPNVYDAVFPAADCGTVVRWYVSAENTAGITSTSPANAPTETFAARAISGLVNIAHFDFETAPGWTTEVLGAISGEWQRGVPVNDPTWAYDPISDSDGSGQCWLTQNELGNTDVDNGAVRLTSPVFDLTAGGVVISYDYFLNLTNSDGADRLLVEISSNGLGGPWIEIARHTTSGALNWRHHEIDQAALKTAGVTMSTNMPLRFTANDDEPQSIVEAGLDAFDISAFECGTCPGDLNGDGVIDLADLGILLADFGCTPPGPCAGDIDGDGDTDLADLGILLSVFGQPCP